jgi:hypothetical protein
VRGKTGTGSAGIVNEVYVSGCRGLIRRQQIMAGFHPEHMNLLSIVIR